MKKTVVELFAGVGGFHLGLSKASPDFNIIWANQWEPGKKVQHAFNCYKEHFGGQPYDPDKIPTICVNEDIAKVKGNIPNHTLLVGGFPCQDYSVARTGAQGMEGKKGVLWWEINAILKDKRPPFVLLENVDRLIKSPSSQRGRDFGVMLSCFNELGYSVEWRVINAADYGFAQRRRRVFIFAYHKDSSYSHTKNTIPMEQIILSKGLFATAFPVESDGKHHEIELDFNDLVEVSNKFTFNFHNAGLLHEGKILSYNTSPIYNKGNYKLLKDILLHNVDDKFFLKNDLTKWKTLKNSKSIERISKTGHKYTFSEGSIAFPDPLNKPARTMLTSESSVNRSTHVVLDISSIDALSKKISPELVDKLYTLNSIESQGDFDQSFLDNLKLRLLTPIECERLNGFADDWTNTGMPEKFRYFCMGNALVVDIVKELGEVISKIIDQEKKE